MRRWITLVTLAVSLGGSAVYAWPHDEKSGGKMDPKMGSKMQHKGMEGLSADEMKFVEMRLSKMSPEERKEKMAKLHAMKPADRKAMIQKMMKGEKMGGKMGDKMHGDKMDKKVKP